MRRRPNARAIPQPELLVLSGGQTTWPESCGHGCGNEKQSPVNLLQSAFAFDQLVNDQGMLDVQYAYRSPASLVRAWVVRREGFP
jgi:hypothetical protein